MISFLFWNLMGRQKTNWAARRDTVRDHLIRMAITFDIDVFLFAESAFAPPDFTAALNEAMGADFHSPPSYSRHIQLYTRLTPGSVEDQFNNSDGRLTIRRLTTPSRAEILLAVFHFQSRRNWAPGAQALQATVTQREISETEDLLGHRRTVLIGDFNMNPFDLGMVGAHALNAMMARDLVQNEGRTIAGQTYRVFYNPMWGHFGDRTQGPPGTHFYPSAGPESVYWNMFDQVLLRPDLMDSLTELRILDSDGERSLLTERGRPRSSTASDHLPILFRLDL
jgi:hypothetical protein